jgi:hypothetical protein
LDREETTMKLEDEVEALGSTRRRRFLKLLSAALAAPTIPGSIRYACNELAGGKAYADSRELNRETFLMEFNFRDQVDLVHVCVPPGLATRATVRRGVNSNECVLFASPGEITEHPGRMYLTNDSRELAPHVDTLAVIDTGEAGDGSIHGHEAANGLRSPGRTRASGNGRMPMYQNDGPSGGGNEPHNSSTPTPASLHNYYQKQLTSGLRNGFTLKGIARSGVHTVYHFGAGLPGAELDRFYDKSTFFGAFPAVQEALGVVGSAEEASLLTRILGRVDQRYLHRRGFGEDAASNHAAQLDEARGALFQSEPRVVELPLTPEEEAYWREGVPPQEGGGGERARMEVWEQFAYASKILRSGITRSVSTEYDFRDVHGDGVRTERVTRVQAQQCARPLARLIQSLKDAGIYDRTVIAVYLTDGSRRPAANSYGDDGKGTLMLAGGMVRGGYYGDVVITGDSGSGHNYGFRPPDPRTGEPGQVQTDWRNRGLRTSSAALWRTVMTAAGVPSALQTQFPDAAGAEPLRFMLR